MSSSRVAAVLLIGGLLLGGCGSGGAAKQQAATPQAANAMEAIAAEEAQWNRDYVARDLERIVDRYASDATIKAPDTPPLSGRWIRRSFQAAMADPNFRLTFAHDRIEVARSGDIAYSRGHYQMGMTDERTRQPANSYGTYLTVWQKQPDGRWKVLEDFMTPGPAPRPLM